MGANLNLSMAIMELKRNTWLFDLFILSIIFIVFYGLFIGMYPLGVPDEARYSEIPREMLASGNFLIPHINGIIYFEKPPLFYWLQTIPISLFGIHYWSLRLVTTLFGVLGCLITYGTTRLLFDRATGILASLILSSTFLYFGMAHLITLDMTLSVLVSASLLCFLIATEKPFGQGRKAWVYAAFIATALGILTKGLVALALPCVVVGLWVLILKRWQQLTKLYLISATFILLAITLPWHVLVQLQQPEFFHFYFIEQQFSLP